MRNRYIAAGFDYTLSWLDRHLSIHAIPSMCEAPAVSETTPAADAGIPGVNLDAVTSAMPDSPPFTAPGSSDFQPGYALCSISAVARLKEQEHQYQFVNNWTDIRASTASGLAPTYAMHITCVRTKRFAPRWSVQLQQRRDSGPARRFAWFGLAGTCLAK